MAISPTHRPSRRSAAVSARPEPTAPQQTWAAVSMVGAWVCFFAGAFCYDQAKPVRHAIDSFFGVSRRYHWDKDWLVAALLIGFGSLLLAAGSVALSYSQHHRRDFTLPVGAMVAGGAAACSVVYYAFKLV